MRRFFWIVLAIVAAALLMPLGIANRQPVALNLDPFGRATSTLVVSLPLSLLLFGVLLLGLVVGGFATWAGQGKWRRTARVKSREAYQWKAQADKLARDMDPTAQSMPQTAGMNRGRTMRIGNGR